MARLTDLPNDIIARIFTLLSPFPTLSNGSLSHASNAFSLALCSTNLLQTFRQILLTSIDATQYSNEPVSPYFPGSEVRDPYHLASLVRLAGPHLRQIMIPEYEESEEFSQWPLLEELPNCPNLEALGFHDPIRPSHCLRRLLATVSRLRIAAPGNWTLRNVRSQVKVLELVNVASSCTRDVLAMLSRCVALTTFNITCSQSHEAGFVPLLVRTLAVSATSVLHVQYRCAAAPMPVLPKQQPLSTTRLASLSTVHLEAGPATHGVIQAFSPLLDESTNITTVHSVATLISIGGRIGITRSIGILGPVHNLEEVLVTRKEETSYILKHASRLRVVEIGSDATDLQGICQVLEGKKLDKVTVPGNLFRNGLAYAKGLAGAKEIVITELGHNEGIWELVMGLPGLLRGLRRARMGADVRVIHVEGCLQVLDGVWQYGRIKGYGVLRGLLWEMERLYDDTGVEFCGLREGVARLVEEKDRMMVIDEM